jgi:hypothetical protein
MGASNFGCIGEGKTMGAAYDNACREATYEYGHDAYNGSISTTRGFISIDRLFPKGTYAKTKIRIMDRAIVHSDDPQMVHDNKGGKRPGKPRDPIPWSIRGLSPEHRELVRNIAKIRTTKWGPCIGATLNNHRYYFAGWAAE